jgi:transaldolase
VDGWVSLEVSPLLAHDTKTTLAKAKELHARGKRPNLFIKIPGTQEGLPAIEEAIFAGVPVNVTLLFSPEQGVWIFGCRRQTRHSGLHLGIENSIPGDQQISV